MNLIFRFIWILLVSKSRPKLGVLEACRTPFRCWPTDLDVLRHMNNGKYFSIMDLARVDLMTRTGVMTKLNSAGYYPVVVSETMKFRRSLKLWQKFDVETVVIGWDDKAFILQQRFISGDVVCAEAVVRARFLKKSGGSVLPTEVLKMANTEQASPALQDWVKSWNQAQL